MKRLDATTLPLVLDRLAALKADADRRWGTLTPPRRLGHMRCAVEMSLGRLESAVPYGLRRKLVRPLLWPIVISGLPWPKNKVKTVTELETPSASDLAAEREQLVAVLHDFVQSAADDPRKRPVVHPAFGRLSMKQWARLHLLHLDYHLRQFGA